MSNRKTIATALVALALVLSACSTAPQPTFSPSHTPAETAFPTQTPTASAVPIPTATFPAASAPITFELSAPRPKTPVSIGNAAQVIELARWDCEDCIVAISPNGAYLAAASTSELQQGGVYLYDLERSVGLWHLPGENARVVIFSPDSSILIDGNGQVWETETGALRMTFSDIGIDNEVWGFSFSGDGSWLAVNTKDGIQIWDLTDGSVTTAVESKNAVVYSMAISPDGSTIAAAYKQAKLILWNVADGEEIAVFNYRNRWISSVAFSPDGETIAAGATDGKVLILEPDSLEILRTLDVTDAGSLRGPASDSAFWVTGVAFSPDGTVLVTGELSTMKLWNVADGSLLGSQEISGGFQDYFVFTANGASLVLVPPRIGPGVLQWFGIP